MARKHLVDCVHAAGPTQKPTCNGYQEVQPCFEEKVQCPCHLHADVVRFDLSNDLPSTFSCSTNVFQVSGIHETAHGELSSKGSKRYANTIQSYCYCSLPQNGQLTVKVGSSEAGKTGYSIENYPEAPGVQGAHSEGTSSGNISIPQVRPDHYRHWPHIADRCRTQ
jgi:hypothetical protein